MEGVRDLVKALEKAKKAVSQVDNQLIKQFLGRIESDIAVLSIDAGQAVKTANVKALLETLENALKDFEHISDKQEKAFKKALKTRNDAKRRKILEAHKKYLERFLGAGGMNAYMSKLARVYNSLNSILTYFGRFTLSPHSEASFNQQLTVIKASMEQEINKLKWEFGGAELEKVKNDVLSAIHSTLGIMQVIIAENNTKLLNQAYNEDVFNKLSILSQRVIDTFNLINSFLTQDYTLIKYEYYLTKNKELTMIHSLLQNKQDEKALKNIKELLIQKQKTLKGLAENIIEVTDKMNSEIVKSKSIRLEFIRQKNLSNQMKKDLKKW